jgi:hypothetical protein
MEVAGKPAPLEPDEDFEAEEPKTQQEAPEPSEEYEVNQIRTAASLHPIDVTEDKANQAPVVALQEEDKALLEQGDDLTTEHVSNSQGAAVQTVGETPATIEPEIVIVPDIKRRRHHSVGALDLPPYEVPPEFSQEWP